MACSSPASPASIAAKSSAIACRAVSRSRPACSATPRSSGRAGTGPSTSSMPLARIRSVCTTTASMPASSASSRAAARDGAAGSPRVCSWLPSPNRACTRQDGSPCSAATRATRRSTASDASGSAVNVLRPSTISASQSSAGSRTVVGGGAGEPLGLRDVARAVRGVGDEHHGAGVVGPPGVLDVPTGVGPPSGDDRGAGEPQAQLRAFRTAQAVDDGLAGFEGLHRAAEQGEHVHALGGRGVLARLVEEGGGAAHRAPAHVRAGQLDEDLAPRGPGRRTRGRAGRRARGRRARRARGRPGRPAPRAPAAAGWRARRRG